MSEPGTVEDMTIGRIMFTTADGISIYADLVIEWNSTTQRTAVSLHLDHASGPNGFSVRLSPRVNRIILNRNPLTDRYMENCLAMLKRATREDHPNFAEELAAAIIARSAGWYLAAVAVRGDAQANWTKQITQLEEMISKAPATEA